MAKAELGEKQLCPHCGAKFYDLGRRPAVCPKCTQAFDPASEALRLRRTKGRSAALDETDEEETKSDRKETDDDDDEELVDAGAAEIDVADPVADSDDDDSDDAEGGDALPPGFSEADADAEEESSDDDIPILDDEEEFTDDDIGEISEDEEEGGSR